ncbi:MAG: dihydrolipoyl dehydrogenase, partial [Simkaniaceae bacterium]|nr:dihydrolipoyl dehydrogenase [Simkaniaceae bacterium]
MHDLIVIGSGPGGYVAAIRAAQLGLKTAIVEKDPMLGGTCLNVGCIPSKCLLYSSHLYHLLHSEGGVHGIKVDNLSLDFGQMMQRKSSVVKSFNEGIAYLMKKNKIEVIQGHAVFIEPHKIKVGELAYEAKHFIIATGSIPTELPFLPFDERRILSSTGLLSLKEIPEKLLVLGAGVIGVELGCVYARLGSQVEFVEFLDRICPTLDRELSASFQKILESQGLSFHLNTKIESADTQEGLTLKSGSQTFSGTHLLVAVGRRPYTQNLGLDQIGITPDPKGFIPINNRFQTTQPHIYAIGDVAGGALLAHKASEEGIAAAELIAGQTAHIEYIAIPSVIYTSPEVASVGFTEEELKEKKISYTTSKFPLKANSRARA